MLKPYSAYLVLLTSIWKLKMNTKITTTLALLIISFSAFAAQTYTPRELRQMVGVGHYPAQGRASTQTKYMSFSACVSTVKGVVSSISGEYPTETILNTGIAYLVKVWTNDSAMTLTCSKPDKKLVITSAKYL